MPAEPNHPKGQKENGSRPPPAHTGEFTEYEGTYGRQGSPHSFFPLLCDAIQEGRACEMPNAVVDHLLTKFGDLRLCHTLSLPYARTVCQHADCQKRRTA